MTALPIEATIEPDGRLTLTDLPPGQRVLITLVPELDATDYLLSNPANAAALRESIQQAREGRTVVRELIDID